MHTRSTTRDQQRKKVPEVVTLDSSDDDDDDGDDADDVVEINISSDSSAAQPRPSVDGSVIIEAAVSVQEPSQDDQQSGPTLSEPSRSDSSFDDYPYNLKLTRFGSFELYKTTWNTQLNVALKDLIGELAKSNKTLVLLRRRDLLSNEKESVPLDGTPSSLDLDSGTILEAIVIPAQSNRTIDNHQPANHQPKPLKDPNVISLKLQDGQRRHLKEYKIGKNEPLKILKERYSEDFNIDLSRMRLSFDGETVTDDDTSDSLDIEDGCVIDVMVK